MYTNREMIEIVGNKVTPVDFRKNLDNQNLIVITSDHPEYRIPYVELKDKITPGTVILDVYGVWQRHKEKLADEGVIHILLGEKDWIKSVRRRNASR